MAVTPGRPGPYLSVGVIAPLVVALGAMAGRYSGLNPGTCYNVAWTAAALSATIGEPGALDAMGDRGGLLAVRAAHVEPVRDHRLSAGSQPR
jgi:hypothetical protein